MGSLKPGATYIYERVDGVTYAREFGDPSSARFPIGWDANTKDTLTKLKEDKLWGEIRREALVNPVLQEALDRVKVLYQLSKKNESK